MVSKSLWNFNGLLDIGTNYNWFKMMLDLWLDAPTKFHNCVYFEFKVNIGFFTTMYQLPRNSNAMKLSLIQRIVIIPSWTIWYPCSKGGKDQSLLHYIHLDLITMMPWKLYHITGKKYILYRGIKRIKTPQKVPKNWYICSKSYKPQYLFHWLQRCH